MQAFNLSDKTKQILGILALVVLSLSIGYCAGARKPYQKQAEVKQDNKTPIASTAITVEPKKDKNEPDLILSNKYTAVIDGKTYEIPTKNEAVQNTGVHHEENKSSIEGNTVKINTSIDVTDTVKKHLPGWEIGAGIATAVNGDSHKVTVPIAIQRNYKTNRAFEIILYLEPEEGMKAQKITLLHKWKF